MLGASCETWPLLVLRSWLVQQEVHREEPWALGSSGKSYWARDRCRCWGRSGGHVFPSQGVYNPIVETEAIILQFMAYWGMSIHGSLNRKRFYFFTGLSIMLG